MASTQQQRQVLFGAQQQLQTSAGYGLVREFGNDLMPVLLRPSLNDAQLVGDRGFPVVVGTKASVKREPHEGSTGSR